MAVAEYGTNQYLALIQRLLHVGISSSNAPALAAMIDADYAETLFDAEFAAYVGAAPPVPPNPGSLDKLIMFYDSTSNSHFRWGTSQESVARALGWLIVTDPAYGADPTGATLSDTAVIAARDAAMSSAVSDLDASGFSRILKTIYFPAGRYLLTSAAALMDGARTNSGVFGYSIAGAPEQTRIVFTPSAANTPLFRNLDRFLFPMVRDIYFIGGNTNAVCAYSASAGTAQGWNWQNCVWWGAWNECFQLDASGGTANGNDSWRFGRCRWKGSYVGSIFHSGISAGVTNQDQAIAHEWTDCNIEPAGGVGDSIFRFDYGGSAIVNGGSLIINTGSGIIFSMPDSGTHETGACSLQVNESRVELRTSTAKLIDCHWQFGSVQFNNVSTDGHSVAAGQITASFDGSGNTGPIVQFNGGTYNGRHEYKYRDNKYLAGISRAIYRGVTITDYVDLQNFLVHTQTSGTGQIGGRWHVSFPESRGGGAFGSTAIGRSYDVEANWQTTLGATAIPRWKSLKTPYGVLPFNATTGSATQDLVLPLGSILIGVHFNMPAKPGGSSATSWSYVLTNGASTISYTCSTGAAWNLGFDTHFWNQYVPLNSDTQRTLTLTATGVTDSNVSGVCFVEFLPGS
jgi:hypothetical protein